MSADPVWTVPMAPPGWDWALERPIAFPDADESIELRAVLRLVPEPDDTAEGAFVLSIEVRDGDGASVGTQRVGRYYGFDEAIAAADRVVVVPILLPVPS